MRSRSSPTEFVVVGGGIVGLTVALELATKDASVRVIEMNEIGSGSTAAAAGIMSPTEPTEWTGILGSFNHAAAQHWPIFAEQLESLSGMASGHEERVEIRLGAADSDFITAALDSGESHDLVVSELDTTFSQLVSTRTERDFERVVQLEPSGAVNVDSLVPALRRALEHKAVELVSGSVVSVDERASGCATITLASDEVLTASKVVVATGAWTDRAPVLQDRTFGVRPVAGEGIVLAKDFGDNFPILRTELGSIVPRQDGTTWIGTSVRSMDIDQRPPIDAVRDIISRAVELLPELSSSRLLAVRTGQRPVSITGFPQIGPVSENVVVAIGHGRDGVIQAPLTAVRLVEGLIDDNWAGFPLEFTPSV